MPTIDELGIIAGSRSLPLLFARQARRMGVRRLVAVGFLNETDPKIEELVDTMVWLRVGQLSKLIAAFTDNRIRHCVMLGQVAPKNLFDVRPDIRAMSLLVRIRNTQYATNAHSLFGAIGEELASEGVELVEPTPWLQPMMASFQLGPALTNEDKADVDFGYRIAKAVSALEIGQTVIVKRGTVLAVEGFEGTDECLKRGGALAGRESGAIAVKVAREKHDMRFDIPCIGAQTIETCLAARISVLAIEAGKTLVLDQDKIEALVKKARFVLTAVP